MYDSDFAGAAGLFTTPPPHVVDKVSAAGAVLLYLREGRT